MTENDLRIGITLYDSLRGNNVEIKQKHFRELFIAENNFFDRYKPIDIDEEYLINKGFVKKYEGESTMEFKLSKYKFELVLIINENLYVIFFGNHKTGKIKYVHELENILSSVFKNPD